MFTNVGVCNRGDKLFEVEPKINCCGLIGENYPFERGLSFIFCFWLFGSPSACSLCNFITDLNHLSFL